MCGIIGYIGDKDITAILLQGLEKLEYRGYDSAGICVREKDEFTTIKENGKIKNLKEKVSKANKINGHVGIAHTRWATHGEPSIKNAHPHIDCKNEFAVVHNGIIENFYSLKTMLEKEGHVFCSSTDSEIIAHLIEKFYEENQKTDLEDALYRTIKCLEGAFGIAIITTKKDDNDNEKIFVARKGSPLIIGIGENEMFVSSDIPAILEHTKKVIYLNDDELAIIEKNSYKIKNFKGLDVSSKIHDIKWSLEEIEKGNYKHFMLKEIFEQPKAIENTLRGRIVNNKIKLSIDPSFFLDIERIIIVACGTSWHSGLIAKTYIEQFTNIPVEVDYASEFRYRNPIIRKTDLVIAISQSGETADTLAALRLAKKNNSKTLGIINVVGSTISREVDSGIYLHAGPEIGVASTKAFTCQITALLLLALYIKQEKGEKLDVNLLNDIKTIPEIIDSILIKHTDVKILAEKLVEYNNFLYLGRGLNFPVALEGALKLKEISYIHAEGYPAAEIKHGPIALIDENMPTIFIAPKDNTFEKILSNMEEVKSRKGRIVVIINESSNEISNLTNDVILVPKVCNELMPIITVIPLQLISYYIADSKGIDVDKPRNLAKSVTVE